MGKLIEIACAIGLALCVVAALGDVIHVAQHGFAAAANAFPH